MAQYLRSNSLLFCTLVFWFTGCILEGDDESQLVRLQGVGGGVIFHLQRRRFAQQSVHAFIAGVLAWSGDREEE